MATITDIEKLRPELLTMSLAELERRRNEIDMAIAQKAAAEEAERRNRMVAEATERVEGVVAGLKWLHAEGFLSDKMTEALTTGAGAFNPGMFIRPPRSVEDVLTAKRPVAKRTRRRRLPDGTLVPSKASLGQK